MSHPNMGLSRDGKTVWYRYQKSFWHVFPVGMNDILAGWGVYHPEMNLEGHGETIPEAITNALESIGGREVYEAKIKAEDVSRHKRLNDLEHEREKQTPPHVSGDMPWPEKEEKP